MNPKPDMTVLAQNIKAWAKALGFQGVGITDTHLQSAEQHLQQWLDRGFQGEMAYMARHGHKRSRPPELLAGTLRIIAVRMDYLPQPMDTAKTQMEDHTAAYIARYALGRDYHKILRKRLQRLADQIEEVTGPFGYRAFVDSAPVLEKALAEKAGLGWIGKHTLLLEQQRGSWFFLGELYTDLPLPVDPPAKNHCGQCRACIDICPTQAIVAPYQLDARRCISYLTIELHGAIPEALRSAIGNRIFGCDDCQLVCPWNRFAKLAAEPDFRARHSLDTGQLREFFQWSEDVFLRRTEGSALRRLGYIRWLRNIAVALGNAPPDPVIVDLLKSRQAHSSALVAEHVQWALEKQHAALGALPESNQAPTIDP